MLIDKYQVEKMDAPESNTGKYWELLVATHLEPWENLGRHNIYVTALDESGNRVRDPNIKIGWTWEGRRDDEAAEPLALDKQDGEPPGNVPLYSPGMKATVWIEDRVNPSDRVVNLHTNHPDELGPNGEIWNSIGHHSFNLVFQRMDEIPIDHPTPPDEKEARVITITAPLMTVTLNDGTATTGPGTVRITISQGQDFAKG